MPVLKTENLTKNFGGLTAIMNLNLQVEKDQIFGLIGPNGAGKSTFFNLITGVYRPSRGTIFFEGEDVTNLKPYMLAERGIGRSFQEDINLPNFTVMDNALTSCHLLSRAGVFSAIARTATYRQRQARAFARALEVLELVGLSDLKTEQVKNLPHGLQRKLGIAMAMAGDPTLLLLDEPVSGLNHTEVEDVMATITQLCRAGNTIILVEHNMKAIMNYCDYIAVLDHGVKIAEGTPGEIVNNKLVIEAYLGVEENAS
jgi:branched-chain amino acid transport system ATP-binding protein